MQKSQKNRTSNPEVYLDIQIGKRLVGRLTIELFADTTPKTAENFRALCTGERGTSPTSGKMLHLKGSVFHRIISGFMAQGGDITKADGTGGESIFGSKFADENFLRVHDSPGLLSMANSGPNSNGSQFFITFRDTPHLNGRHVVFGQVTAGLDILRVMEMAATDSNDRPRTAVVIAESGQIGLVADPVDTPSTSGTEVHKAPRVKDRESGPVHEHGDVGGSKTSSGTRSITTDTETAPAQAKAAVATEEEDEMDEAAIAARTAGMSDMEKRLFKLRLKLNQGRKANKKEVDAEFRRLSDKRGEGRQSGEERGERKKAAESEMSALGLSKKQGYMLDTAEKAGREQEKKEVKDRNRATFGWEAFTVEASYRSYDKQLSKLPKTQGVAAVSSSSGSLEDNPLLYGRVGAEVSKEGLARLTKSIEDKAKANQKHSRRRTSYDAVNTDSINDPNAHFNKKIKRAFDKYTVEIRQNLERGTAL